MWGGGLFARRLLVQGLPMHVLACVVDRPGYNKRYLTLYGPRRWKLCRTAFNIVVERAAKVAISRGSRLRVYAERSDKQTEAHFNEYFNAMRVNGLPFDANNSKKYQPLSKEQLQSTLFEFRIKTKDSLRRGRACSRCTSIRQPTIITVKRRRAIQPR